MSLISIMKDFLDEGDISQFILADVDVSSMTVII